MKKIRRFPLTAGTGGPVFGLGLLTDESDYRLCWLINQNFSWDLSRSEDITVIDKGSPVSQSFSCFESRPGYQPAIKLISNRSKEGLWLTAFRQIDFILVVSAQDPSLQDLEGLKSTLSAKIPQIRGLFKVPLPSFCYL